MSAVGTKQVFMGWEGKMYFSTMGDGSYRDLIAEQVGATTASYSLPIGVGLEIARLRNIGFQVTNAQREYYEIGEKCPVEIRTGNYSFSGSFQRGFVNGGLLRWLLGQSDLTAHAATDPLEIRAGTGGGQKESPMFNMLIELNSGQPAGATEMVLTIIGAQLGSWAPSFPQGDFIMESTSFRALGFKIEERSLTV